MLNTERTAVMSRPKAIVEDAGKYLYCVADVGERMSLGAIGIDGKEVYTIPYKDICAVSHSCPALPYQSDNAQLVEEWIRTHLKVVDTAWAMRGTVLPLGFNTIVKGKEEDAELKVEDWLKQQYEELKTKIETVRGKVEYGVQIFWDPKFFVQSLIQTDPELRKLDEAIKIHPRGLAYMYRQRLENIIRRGTEAKAADFFRNFLMHIRDYADDIHIEKTRKAEEGSMMIMNLSCLVFMDKYVDLGEQLSKIEQLEGFSVRFTGPWPPYSFVGGA